MSAKGVVLMERVMELVVVTCEHCVGQQIIHRTCTIQLVAGTLHQQTLVPFRPGAMWTLSMSGARLFDLLAVPRVAGSTLFVHMRMHVDRAHALANSDTFGTFDSTRNKKCYSVTAGVQR
jgi:hypothetical protein